MKKLLLIIACLAAAVITLSAAPKAEKKITTTVFTTDIDCPVCAKKITNNIPLEKGVIDVTTNVKEKTATVTYDANKTNKEALTKAFNSLRIKVFKAEDIASK